MHYGLNISPITIVTILQQRTPPPSAIPISVCIKMHHQRVETSIVTSQPGKVVTITIPCGIPGVVIGVTKGITHGSGLDRKPVGSRNCVPRPTYFSCQVPLHVLFLNYQLCTAKIANRLNSTFKCLQQIYNSSKIMRPQIKSN